jgi:hypothetical protein
VLGEGRRGEHGEDSGGKREPDHGVSPEMLLLPAILMARLVLRNPEAR